MKQGFFEIDFQRKRIKGAAITPIPKTGPQLLDVDDWGEFFMAKDQTDVTYTFPNDLPIGWNVSVLQRGEGRISFVGQQGVTFLDEGGENWSVSRGKNTVISFVVIENQSGGDEATILVLGGAVDTSVTDTTAPIITSGDTFEVNEGAPFTGLFEANEPVTWAVSGTNSGLVSVNANTGAWSVGPQDYDTQPTVTFTVTATDGAGNSTAKPITLTIKEVVVLDTTKPIYTGATSFTIAENTTQIGVATANENVIFGLVAESTDAPFISINGSTGVMAFKTAPDFDNPADDDKDNVYAYVLRLTDLAGNVTDVPITVSVTDVADTVWDPATSAFTNWWDITDPTTVFSDLAGTVQAVPGTDSIALWKDKKGTAHLSEATLANRPTLITDSLIGNKRAAKFTRASQQRIWCDDPNIGAGLSGTSKPYVLTMLVRRGTPGVSVTPAGLRRKSGTTHDYVRHYFGSSNSIGIQRSSNGTATTISSTATDHNTDTYFVVTYAYSSAGNVLCRSNGTQKMNQAGVTGPVTLEGLSFGAYFDNRTDVWETGTYFDGTVVEAFLGVGMDGITQDVIEAEKALAAKGGITLANAATDIVLSNTTVAAYSPDDTVIGTLSAPHPSGLSSTFKIVSGPIAQAFKIVGNQLKCTNWKLVYGMDNGTTALKLQATDTNGTAIQKDITLTVTPQAETGPLLARTTHDMIHMVKGHYDRLIYDLKQAGSYSKMAGLFVMSSRNEGLCLLNWKGAGSATKVGATAWKRFKGYKPNGATTGTTYIDTGIAANTLTAGNLHLGVYSRSPEQKAKAGLGATGGGSAVLELNPRTTGDKLGFGLAGAATTTTAGVTNGAGHFLVTRDPTTNTDVRAYREGTLLETKSAYTVGTLPSGTITIGLTNGDATAVSDREVSIVHFGTALTDAEAKATWRAFRRFLIAVNAYHDSNYAAPVTGTYKSGGWENLNWFDNFENAFLRYPVSMILDFLPHGPDMSNISGYASTLFDAHQHHGKKILMSVPMCAGSGNTPKAGQTVADVANGLHDAHFVAIAQAAVAKGIPGEDIIWRIGWEANGGWYAFRISTVGPAVWIAAWRRIAGILKANCPGSTTHWCLNKKWLEYHPEQAYPGDDVVDYVGLDIYHDHYDTRNVTPTQVFKGEWLGHSSTVPAQSSSGTWYSQDFCAEWMAQKARDTGKMAIIGEYSCGFKTAQNAQGSYWPPGPGGDQYNAATETWTLKNGTGDDPIMMQGAADFIKNPANKIYAHVIWDFQADDFHGALSGSSSVRGYKLDDRRFEKPGAATVFMNEWGEAAQP